MPDRNATPYRVRMLGRLVDRRAAIVRELEERLRVAKTMLAAAKAELEAEEPEITGEVQDLRTAQIIGDDDA